MRGQKRYHKTKRGTIGTTLGRASTYHSLPWVGEGLGGAEGPLLLHSLWHLDAKKLHGVLDGLAHVARELEAEHLLGFRVG